MVDFPGMSPVAMKVLTRYPGRWFFSVDRGGTFTDVMGIDPRGEVHMSKLLSRSDRYADPAIEGIARMMGVSRGHPLPQSRVATIRMGTTVATNALLERKGIPVALFITRGFRDLLEIGYQNRPHLFKLVIEKPEKVYRCVKEVNERIDHTGKVIRPLDADAAWEDLLRIRRMGISSVAIVLMHSWKKPDHEIALARLARKAGFPQVSVSHEIMPLIKIVDRGQTTVVDAYLSPLLRAYIESIRRYTGNIHLEFMQSSGGILDAPSVSGKDAILSGPAGGVIGAAAVARLNNLSESIGIDMGGTSTDVSRYDGTFEKVLEMKTGGIQFHAPALRVNTVAAGGGSLLWFDGQKLRVGPESAGARPGPASYGLGGPLALTDANLLLGRLIPAYFPKTFGSRQQSPLDTGIVKAKFRELTAEINGVLGTSLTPVQVALGFVKIANETMARAIKEISVSRGFDVRTHGLIAFGGAAPQHACALARILGMQSVVIHPAAGILSAYGIAGASHLRYMVKSVIRPLDRPFTRSLSRRVETLAKPEVQELIQAGSGKETIRTHCYLDIRPEGTDTFLTLPVTHPSRETLPETLPRTFRKEYRRLFGFDPADSPLEVVNIRVEVVAGGHLFRETRERMPGDTKGRVPPVLPRETVPVYFHPEATSTPVYRRQDCPVGCRIRGPAVIVEEFSTTVVEPGFAATVSPYRHLILTREEEKREMVSTRRDPVMLEVFNHLFMSAAEQMGYTLANTAHSTNIKERHDFSCAIFDPEGNLVANAPHIPVHLGAMGESVKSIIADNKGRMRPGDVYCMNNPHKGGSHLPDVTVVAPVFSRRDPGDSPLFYVASRGHHADIGGIAPGSMPPFSSSLEEEGVVIDNFLLVREGRFRERQIRELLLSGPYPARNLEERISDLKAQIASLNAGIRELDRLVEKYGFGTVRAYMGHVRDNAARAMEEALARLLLGKRQILRRFEDTLDDGSTIAVRLTLMRGNGSSPSCTAEVDFSGTGPQIPGNLNAPVSVTKAAVLYVFRSLIDEDIPLNSGCMVPITVRIPRGCLLNPSSDAAVAGGNVETSQRIVDVLLGALGVAAASQGTMNNFLFGRADGRGKQYYETIAGGSGATPGHRGATAVQVHMTNTRITDPEVLESRYPEVRIDRFAIRRGSGGKGKFRGGDGTIREILFLRSRKASIVSERRRYPPYGLAGGSPGVRGRNLLIRSDGSRRELGGKAQLTVKRGDRIVIKTPGGGGYGKGSPPHR